METWVKVFREGVCPSLSDAGLGALRAGLVADDPCLLQGATTSPPPLTCVQDWAVEGACLVGYCAWQGDGLQTVGEVEEYFARVCFQADQRMGEPAACRYLLNWFDEEPRAEVVPALLAEVNREIQRREKARAA